MNESAGLLQEVLQGDAVSLAQAAKLLPPSRGRAVAPSTLFRWVTVGIRLEGGVILRLEAARVGGRWLTSKAALMRWLARQNGDLPAAVESAPATAEVETARTPARRQRAVAAAVAACEAAGL